MRGGAARDIPDSLPGPALQTAEDAPAVDPDPVLDAGAHAARARPAFGSVTQSSNSDGSGLTTDAASVEFRDGEFTLAVAREDGSDLTLATDRDAAGIGRLDTPVPGHVGRGFALFAASEDPVAFTVAALYTSWDDSDPTDYLAGGYWMRVAFDIEALDPTDPAGSAPDAVEVEVGAFVDGPGLSAAPTLPALGTASYEGPSGGLYAYRYGSGHEGVADGTAELGEYSGTAELTADFAAGSISGAIRDIAASGTRTDPSGAEETFEDARTLARIGLGPATVDAQGRFSDGTVGLAIAGRGIDAARGSWGGRFSAVPDAEGDPRLVAGTAGAEWEERDGSRGAVVGTFIAAKP